MDSVWQTEKRKLDATAFFNEDTDISEYFSAYACGMSANTWCRAIRTHKCGNHGVNFCSRPPFPSSLSGPVIAVNSGVCFILFGAMIVCFWEAFWCSVMQRF